MIDTYLYVFFSKCDCCYNVRLFILGLTKNGVREFNLINVRKENNDIGEG